MPSNSDQPQSDDSLLKRYLALKSLRDNIFYTKPVTDSAVGAIEDIPGEARSLSGPLADALSSRAIISNDPAKRRAQIAAALEKARGAAGSSEEMKTQMLSNALRLGAIAAPVGFAAGGILSMFGKGKGLRNSINLLRAPTETLPSGGLNRAGQFKNLVLNRAIEGGAGSAVLGAAGGAAGGLNAGTAKPSEDDLQAAAKILQEHPYTSGLPGGELTSVLNSYNQQNNPALSTGIGAGVGAGVGALGTLIPPTVEAAQRAVTNPFKAVPKSINLMDWYARAARKSMGRNALLLGGLGGLAGYATSQHNDNV
jgi:hypothetical protein